MRSPRRLGAKRQPGERRRIRPPGDGGQDAQGGRERLLAETRAGIIARLGIDRHQLNSALTMLDSKLDLSLSTVLRASCRSYPPQPPGAITAG